MRTIATALIVASALALALPAHALEPDEARHLLARSGFAPRPEEVDMLRSLTWEQAVDLVLAGTKTKATEPPPTWVDDPPPDVRAVRQLPEAERNARRKETVRKGVELRAWWWREIGRTDSPLTERMTLFWSNHFTSSLQKVKWPPFLYRQNVLLREHALGSFADMLHAVARDPAMVLYLDSQQNRADAPNENFARELLELFTLGEGHYSEKDIKEAARAFTGWTVDRRAGTFRFAAARHDDGEKTFLGKTGPFDGDDILDILLDQPRTAEMVSEELWHELCGGEPSKADVGRIAGILRNGHWQVKPAVRAILLSAAFRDPAQRGTRTKSPVELIAGAARQLGVPVTEGRRAAIETRQLGQDLFNPPTVQGWPEDQQWITSDALLERRQFIETLVGMADPSRVARLAAPASERVVLAVPPTQPIPPDLAPAERVKRLMLDPAYEVE